MCAEKNRSSSRRVQWHEGIGQKEINKNSRLMNKRFFPRRTMVSWATDAFSSNELLYILRLFPWYTAHFEGAGLSKHATLNEALDVNLWARTRQWAALWVLLLDDRHNKGGLI